jgi:hypothetical protein
MTSPVVAPELFDVLIDYAKDIQQGKIKPTRLVSTSPALTFCDNFYAQFFQNELGQEITSFSSDAKKIAVQCRLEVKDKGGLINTIQLITLFEKLCDDYPDILALAYGTGTKTAFLNFHNNYLLRLLERASAWAEAKKYSDIQGKAGLALSALRNALKSIPK